MKRLGRHLSRLGATLLVMALTPVLLYSTPTPYHNPSSSPTDKSQVSCQIQETSDRTMITISISGILSSKSKPDLSQLFSAEGKTGRLGYPELPAVGRWIRVPDRGMVTLRYQTSGERRISGEIPTFCQEGEDNSRELRPVELSSVWPAEPAVMGEPMIMRGVRMVSLTYFPVRWDPQNQEYLVSEGISLSVETTAESGENEVSPLPRRPSQGFDRMVDALLLNPPKRDPQESTPPGGYLVVANEDAPEAVSEFVDWKRRAGHPVELLTFDPVVTDQFVLKEMIQERYNETYFEYLVFMGSDQAQPPLKIPFDGDYYDVYYAQLEGDDMLPDVAVGVFNCLTEDNLTCAIRRAISYQSEPLIGDTNWFTRAGVAAGACSVPNDLSPSYTCKWITEVLGRRGFSDIQTSYYSDNEVDDPSRMTEDLYNQGANFIFNRAHERNLDTGNIEATGIYPFHFLVSSSTIAVSNPPNEGTFNRIFRLGTPQDMRGPSAGFGHYSSPRTNCANALAGGLIWGMFFLDLGSYGWARNYTVANLQFVMPADGVDLMPYYYSHWRYYGDPGQGCWMGVPKSVEVETQVTGESQESFVQATVTSNDNPVTNALVCLSQGDLFQKTAVTDNQGRVSIIVNREAIADNMLSLTITGSDIYPNKKDINLGDATYFASPEEIHVDDSEAGDNDGIANPGEIFSLTCMLYNRGDQIIGDGGFSVAITSMSPWVAVEGVIQNQGDLNPGEALQIDHGVRVTVANGCPDGTDFQLLLTISFGAEEVICTLPVVAVGPQILVTGVNAQLTPGEESEVSPVISNRGHKGSAELIARLTSLSPFINIIRDAAQYPELLVGDAAEPDGDPFAVLANINTIPGSIAHFQMIVTGDPGVQDTLYFDLPAGQAAATDPFGPDKYGFIAIDNEDDSERWVSVPEYDWVEICPWRPDPEFQGDSLPILMGGEDDTTLLMALPFTFRYYGQDFDTISICSNGWIAVGNQTNLKNQQNWTMPWSNGAFGMMAVFWDRLWWDMRSDGLVSYFDIGAHRFIIEWATAVKQNNQRFDNIFEVIIYDPNFYSTYTGDAQILFQYHTVNNVQDEGEANAHCTVGISSPDGMDGLTYTNWGNYPSPACAPLENGRAILWTTNIGNPEATIWGRVTRYIDSTGVRNVSMRISEGPFTSTDSTGFYVFHGVEPGVVEVTASYFPDYDEIAEIQVEAGGIYRQDFVMAHPWPVFDPDTLVIIDTLIVVDSLIPYPTPFNITITNQGNADFQIDDVTVDDPRFYLDQSIFPMVLDSSESEVIRLAIGWPWDLPVGIYLKAIYFYTNLGLINYPIVIEIYLSTPKEPEPVPIFFDLSQPFPNPFNSATTVRFAVPFESEVRLLVLDLAGREVATLSNQRYAAGWHQVSLDGEGLSTGIYFLRMKSGGFKATRQILLLR